MNDEELEQLIKDASEQIDKLSDREQSLTKEERNRKIVLELQKEALAKIKAAKEKGSLTQEVRASIDYALLTRYGEKHPLLLYFLKAQHLWYGF